LPCGPVGERKEVGGQEVRQRARDGAEGEPKFHPRRSRTPSQGGRGKREVCVASTTGASSSATDAPGARKTKLKQAGSEQPTPEGPPTEPLELQPGARPKSSPTPHTPVRGSGGVGPHIPNAGGGRGPAS
jgi:hypothetical protein